MVKSHSLSHALYYIISIDNLGLGIGHSGGDMNLFKEEGAMVKESVNNG